MPVQHNTAVRSSNRCYHANTQLHVT